VPAFKKTRKSGVIRLPNTECTPTTVDAEQPSSSEATSKKTRKSRVIRLPKARCTIPFLTALFFDLSNKGIAYMKAGDVAKAANIVLNAKADLNEGKAWNGKIKIAENLYLKLYKTGLVLYHKQ